jgi:predicted Zn-dependent protease
MIVMTSTSNDIVLEGSRLLRDQPELALERFAEARAIFLKHRDGTNLSALSVLIARAWERQGSVSKAAKWAHRAVLEDPYSSGSWYTFAHFCEQIGVRAMPHGSKRVRTLAFTFLARASYACAADFDERPEHCANLRASAKRLSGYAP